MVIKPISCTHDASLMSALGLSCAWSNGVYPNLCGAKLLAQNTGNGHDRALRRGIDRCVGAVVRNSGSGDVDDAAALRPKVLQRFLRRQEHRQDVCIELIMEIVLTERVDRPEPVDADVVDQDVEPTERLLSRVEEALHISRLGDVTLELRWPRLRCR